MLKTRISIPSDVQPGDVIEIKTLVSHPMESGFRRDNRGELIPRNIIKTFRCDYLGRLAFEAEFFPGVAANPFLSFFLKATGNGELVFTWTDQDGVQTTLTRKLILAEPE